jgi:hypothetical protein
MNFTARNTNLLAPAVYQYLRSEGQPAESRNGPVLVAPEPVTICIERPEERVNLCPVRDANPFFHLMEAMAMLAGMNNAPFLAHFARRMMQYSDDGLNFSAFYGERLRRRWGDQLAACIEILHKSPHSRQAVAGLWDPGLDLMRREHTVDRACNLSLVFAVDRDGSLTMTSFNRSNDAIWGGVTGANIVHLSFFQEYVACALGRPIGKWWHVSANLHVYTDNPQWERLCQFYLEAPASPPIADVYPCVQISLFTEPAERRDFDHALSQLMGWCAAIFTQPPQDPPEALKEAIKPHEFLWTVVYPMFLTWQIHKQYKGREEWAARTALTIQADDWREAATNWLRRRKEALADPS